MGFASSPATHNALALYGIRATGFRWKWAPGLKGGVFPDHHAMNGQVSGAEGFDVSPGDDVNGDTCCCWMVPAYRTPDGRLAKPGLQPAFLPPVVASVQHQRSEPIDFGPLVAVLADREPTTVNVTVPDFPEFPPIPAPHVRMEAATVNVPAPVVNVAAPNVTVEPAQVTVTPNIVIPTPDAEPIKVSTYFAGVEGKVTIPKGQAIVAISCVPTPTKDGSVKIGSNPTIIVPTTTTWFDTFDDAPIPATSVTFKNTVAYEVRTI